MGVWALLGGLLLHQPASADTYPLLEEINRQTQSLYQDVQGGIVRVQLPVPKWVAEAAAKDDPLKKWDKVVDPDVRRKLQQHQQEAMQSGSGRIQVRISATPNAGAPQADQETTDSLNSSWKITPAPGGSEIVMESKGEAGQGASIILHAGGEAPGANVGPMLRLRPPPGTFAPNNIGLLLDDQGHVLVPLYIERESIGEQGVRVMIADAEATATFVGSDEKTQITILKLSKPVGRPVRLSAFRPGDGSMVMLLNPNNGSGRLALWTGGQRDYGVVVGMDGTVAGLVRYGQFLGGPACRPVIEQLIRVGRVQRAILGVRLTEVHPEDVVRQRLLELGDRPALAVDEVAPNSIAAASGLQPGDFILELDGHPVGDLTTWAALSARNAQSRLLILRDGKQMAVTVDMQVAR